jgi:hypothetical protein
VVVRDLPGSGGHHRLSRARFPRGTTPGARPAPAGG